MAASVLVGDSLVLVGLILLPDESCSIWVLLNMAVQAVVCSGTNNISSSKDKIICS